MAVIGLKWRTTLGEHSSMNMWESQEENVRNILNNILKLDSKAYVVKNTNSDKAN